MLFALKGSLGRPEFRVYFCLIFLVLIILLWEEEEVFLVLELLGLSKVIEVFLETGHRLELGVPQFMTMTLCLW
jgi:hypothetical protein